MLQKQGGITVHAIQGRKASDHHNHKSREQLYYILGGEGAVRWRLLSPEGEEGGWMSYLIIAAQDPAGGGN